MATSHSKRSLCTIYMAMVVAALVAAAECSLHPSFYDSKCPDLQKLVQGKVRAAMRRDERMPASLLRLHFHDCFVNVCTLSILPSGTYTCQQIIFYFYCQENDWLYIRLLATNSEVIAEWFVILIMVDV